METKDTILRGTACNNQFRFMAINSTHVVQTALDLHRLSPAATLLLGRLLTAALLMGADQKTDAASLTLNIEAEGDLKGAIAIYEAPCYVRGYAKNPDFFDAEVKNNWQIGKLLGKGTLNVIKDLNMKEPMTGTIELETGEVAEDIAHYYMFSEQIPTAVSLGVLFDEDGKIRSSGGYLIQQLPSANPADVDRLELNLANTPYITDLLDMGLDWARILSQSIFKDMDYFVSDTISPMFRCNCSKQRFGNALKLLGIEELSSMQEGISPVCHYCNTQYYFSPQDIQEIIDSIAKEKPHHE